MSEDVLRIKSYFHEYEAQFLAELKTEFNKAVGNKRYFAIADQQLLDLHGDRLDFLDGAEVLIKVEAVEKKKSLDTASVFCSQLLDEGITKNDYILVIGGGLTQDLGAFCAHVLKRGIPWVFIPTTLLSMCDSCIGSKYGINMSHYKNQIGGFCPPAKIFLDTAFLETLDPMDIYSGLGEIVKVHIIAGPEYFARLANIDVFNLLNNRHALRSLIWRSLEIKKKIVEIDEFDKNYRHVLNYGHTFGHAIESYTGNRIPHGIAVAMGMEIANYISVSNGFLAERTYDELRNTIGSIIPSVDADFSDLKRMGNHLRQDKKFDGKELTFLLSRNVGEVFQHRLEVDTELCHLIKDCYSIERHGQ